MTWPALRFPFTSAALAAALIVLTVAIVGHVNLIQLPVSLIARIEQDEIDDIVTVLLLVGVAFSIDQVALSRRINRTARLDAERLRVVQVTMRTVQDIVNNCLNELQLLRFDAEGRVPLESLTLFDDAVRETVTKLTELGDLRAYAERQMVVGTGLAFPKRGTS